MKKENPTSEDQTPKVSKGIKKRRKRSRPRNKTKSNPPATDSNDSSIEPRSSTEDIVPEENVQEDFFDAHGSYLRLPGKLFIYKLNHYI